MDDRREARAEGGRRFQREGAITAKDLDMAMVVLVRGTKRSRLSMERRGRRDVAEVGSRMASRRYLGATPIWALRTISRALYSMRVEIGSQWRCHAGHYHGAVYAIEWPALFIGALSIY